jgi:hypothetical protein
MRIDAPPDRRRWGSATQEDYDMKSMRKVLLLSGILTLGSLGVVAFLLFWGPDRVDFAGRRLSDLWESKDLVPLIVVPIALVIMGVTMVPFFRIAFPDKIENGVNARAKVLKVWDTGVSINDNPQVGLLLEVTPLGGSIFQVETKTIVSRLSVALVQAGTTAEVRYDPQNPKRMRVLNIDVEDAVSGGAVGRMEQLDLMREKGLITQDEYHQKREDILKEL